MPEVNRRCFLKRPETSAKINNIVFVYNANGGIYPGIADFLHKMFVPSSYPCNLCYQTFGTFGMKKEWKAYLDSIPFEKAFMHKDRFKKGYIPENLLLPCLLASDGKQVWQALSAVEINRATSLQDIIIMLNPKLTL